MKSVPYRLIFLGVLIPAVSVSGLAQTASHRASQHAQAANIFNANCAVCHGPDGTGSLTGKSLNVPNLRSAVVQKQSNTAIARFIGEGKNQMPSFKTQLNDEQIASVVAYVRWLAHHKVSP